MGMEVLVATMHQKDFSKIKEMNIQSDVVFANQADFHGYAEEVFNGNTARMISTDQRGVGRNRNLALLYAKQEILLFSDDDMEYSDGYSERVLQAFKELPQADVIIFECDLKRAGEVYFKIRHKTGKLPHWKSWRYGTYVIAARKSSLEKKNIYFHTQFGGGCKYSSGEDSLFLTDCYKKGLKIFTYAFVLGHCKKDSSTWFKGYTEKYFLDKGVWLACAMPKLSRVMSAVCAVKWSSLSKEMGMLKIYKLMNKGITQFKKSGKE